MCVEGRAAEDSGASGGAGEQGGDGDVDESDESVVHLMIRRVLRRRWGGGMESSESDEDVALLMTKFGSLVYRRGRGQSDNEDWEDGTSGDKIE